MPGVDVSCLHVSSQVETSVTLTSEQVGDVDEGDVSGWTADADADNASRSNPVETTEVEGK